MIGVLPVKNFGQNRSAISILTSNTARKVHTFRVRDPDSLCETYRVLQCFLFPCIIPLEKFPVVLLHNCLEHCANTAKIHSLITLKARVFLSFSFFYFIQLCTILTKEFSRVPCCKLFGALCS